MKHNFFNIFKGKSVLGKLARGGTGYTMDPLRDWTMGLIFGALIFIVGVSFIAYDFMVQMRVPKNEIVVEGKEVRYREKDVVRFAETFTEREKMFNTLREKRILVPTARVPSGGTTEETNSKELIEDTAEVPPLADGDGGEYTESAPQVVQ